jgi:hypothetical protein
MGKPPHDMFETVRAWNRCHGAFYQVREDDLRWNLEQQDFVVYEAGELAGTSVIVGTATAKGVATGILEKAIWFALYGEIPVGREADFAAALEARARAAGRTRAVVGADEFHFLPGVPVDDESGQRLAEAFAKRGFAGKNCVDYVGSLGGTACAKYVASAREDAARRGFSLRLVTDQSDRAELTAFLRREFPGRWLREWEFQLGRSDADRAFWNLLRDEAGRVVGFSRLAQRGRVSHGGWTPGAIRLAPGPTGFHASDACLGPIGVAASERGRGAGKLLLGLSLYELSLQGADLTCIDWTDAYNYYIPLEFPAARRYRCLWKDL